MVNTVKVFGKIFLGSVIVLSAGFATLYFLGFKLPQFPRCLGIIIALSVLFSTLLTADSKTRPASTSEPTTFWAGVIDLLTNRQPLLFFLLIGIAIAVAGTYYLLTSLVTVRYAGESGVIVSLPGQTVYYLAIDPYESWIDTHIQLAKDERFTVELSGRVSPGYLQGLERLQAQYDELSKATSSGVPLQVRPTPASADIPKWRFTGPEGYDPSWYESESLLEVFKHEPVSRFYGKEHAPGYKNDDGLTVKGYPHNWVIGIIVPDNETSPKVAKWDKQKQQGIPGSGYDSEKDKDILLVLSSKRYPIECHAPRAGRFWVVINDTESFRWDNAGFFFMKLIRYSGLR